ncbi:MAG: NAD-dependent epimerase/dehydratase family protein [Chitinophagaceae bacterium]|nr:NAD-dependent epimerase/dehydratase family protein [Chitinophagaceae bacterium]
MTKVLVTGAAGFIGSHVADHCLRLGFEVVATDDLSGGYMENVPMGCTFIKGNLTDKSFVEGLFNDHAFEYIYHLGAYAAEGLSHFIRGYNYQTNLLASIYLINQAVLHKVKCFVFTSSIAVYGAGQSPMNENTIPMPEDPYGISKYAVELDLKSAHEMFGLNYIIFRPHNVYGERQNIADRYRNVVGIFMNQVLQDLPMTVFGDGKQTRAFSYIDDVAPVIAESTLNNNAYQQIFNIGADKAYTVNELANIIAEAFNKPVNIKYLPSRLEVVHAFSDHLKLRNYFKVPEPISLEEGINRMAKWVIKHGAREQVVFEEIEIEDKLPPSWKIKK